jgi:hypothetical protein
MLHFLYIKKQQISSLRILEEVKVVMLILQYRNIASKENGESTEKDSIVEKPVANPDLAALIHSTEQDLETELGTLSDEDENEEGLDGCEEYESDEEVIANDLFHLEFRQHKKDYYMNKMEYGTVNRFVKVDMKDKSKVKLLTICSSASTASTTQPGFIMFSNVTEAYIPWCQYFNIIDYDCQAFLTVKKRKVLM